MEKIIKKTKTIEETHTYCDCCGKEFHWGVCASSLHSCKMCENIMCDDCREELQIDNDETLWHNGFDESQYICKVCAKIIKPHAEKFNDIWEKYLIEKRNLKEDWKKERSKLQLHINEVE